MKTNSNLINLLVTIILTATGCSQQNKKLDTPIEKTTDSSITQKINKDFGPRLFITGNFDNDQATDTIYESYISSTTSHETFKTLDTEDWEHNVELIIQNRPIARLYTNIADVDTFIVSNETQQRGISFFTNLGDLNGDSIDEFGYAINWADNSNINTYHVLTIRNSKFEEIFNFKINESVNMDPEELIDGKFLIRAISPKNIEYKFYSDSATVESGKYIFE